ncbi:hypothetical protein PENSPDRAFT_681531 [Peniophora sp. CONT]|nr:hypothetical protein PENSPDRAFT_681531 [Peniophora sp. CONT]
MSRLPPISSPPPLNRSSSSSMSWAQRSASNSSALAKQGAGLDPDELFTKHSVAEVRNVQLRLRADADAKQEELRLMVGERYRDLLQASTSIIALASASERVRSALDEMRAAVPDPRAQLELSLPRRAGDSTKNDSHLNALQSLAAHAKLLLDTPEHLWRLLERRRFLHAAWLFLLARVIHRALVRPAEEGDDEDWKTHGIDVEEQFPLVQRQWETITPFKSQIAYKASLSLRDSATTVEDICAVLLTLHLLDSQPLPKTLDTLLAQRTRSLQAALAHPPTPEDPLTRKAVVRAVRISLESVLSSIALTLGAARRIFEPPGSLMESALSFIQEPDLPAPEGLPSELQISTTSLLNSLPSASSQIGLLPESIRGYRPYMAADSVPVVQTHLAERLAQWHTTAATELARAAGTWLGALDTLADVWAVRRGAGAWADADEQLSATEIAGLLEALDSAVHARAGSIWRAQLDNMSAAFSSELSAALRGLHDSESEAQLDASPASFLFRAPPPVSAHDTLGSGSMASQFRAYAEGLRAQAAGRAPLLSKVLGALESRGAALAADLKATEGGAATSGSYTSDADSFFTHIVGAVETQANEAADAKALAFVTRVAHELVRSSFLADVRAGTDAGAEFDARVDAIREAALGRWRALAVGEVLDVYSVAWKRSVGVGAAAGPSSALMQALLSIVSASRTVYASVLLDADPRAAGETLRAFIATLLDSDLAPAPVQTRAFVWDLRFLRKLALLWGAGWEDVVERLDERITQLESSLDTPSTSSNPDTVVSDHIARTNVLLAPLLPPGATVGAGGKASGKASSAVNGLDSSAPSTMELVKPGPRFGLLLVGAVG